MTNRISFAAVLGLASILSVANSAVAQSPFGLFGDSWYGPGNYSCCYPPTSFNGGSYSTAWNSDPCSTSCQPLCGPTQPSCDSKCKKGCEGPGCCALRTPRELRPDAKEQMADKGVRLQRAIAKTTAFGSEQVVRARQKTPSLSVRQPIVLTRQFPENDGWIPVAEKETRPQERRVSMTR